MKVFELEGVGPVTLVKRRRAKKLSISLEPTREIRVSVPYYISFQTAQESLLSNMNWVRRYLDKMDRVFRSHEGFISQSPVVTRGKARVILKERFQRIAVAGGFSYGKLAFRAQKTLWGSCSASGNISLNIKLARLPEDLIDYVITHELMHTRIRDHGRYFWYSLDALLGDARALDRRLKKYCPALL